MKLKQCMIIGITVCLILGSMSGCSSKEEGNSQSSQQEQTIQMNQTEEEINENEDVKNEEEQQPTTVTADYTEAFQSIQGCAVIFDSENNTYTFYNEDKCRTRVSPNSTFKVISTLIGLHNQVVTSEDSKMEYDGMNYPVDAWNADLSLSEAFQSSCVWYFRKVTDEVGQEKVQEELDKLAYGNCDISEWSGSGVNPFPELNGFWIESSLLISPIEQVEVLHKIMEGELYTESEIEILKSIMLIQTGDSKKIYGKTGTGTDGTAWFIGFVENGDANIYFAVYLDDDSLNEISGTKAQEIALNILEEYGCSSASKLSDNPIVFEQGINEEYAYLSVDDKIYVPYCPWKREYLGDCIGYYDYTGDEYTESFRVYIYELEGYSSDEWIIEYNSEINEGMIRREINTTVIPDGLTSEYEWNK